MIYISELLKNMSVFKPQSFTLECGVSFEIIALDEDLKEMVENADSTFERHNLASTYGLSVDGVRAVNFKNLDEEMIGKMYESEELPDDIKTLVAEKVLELSGMDVLHPSAYNAPIEEDEILEDELEEVSEESLYELNA